MKRVALLGATGSIGRQAIEIVERSPELELCALMSGAQPLGALADAHGVEHVQVGGSAERLLEESGPDIVLNAIVGFAGVEATLWALDNGVTLALANKESLVAAGELAVAAHRRGGGLLLPVDSEHSALFQCLEGRDPDTVETLVLTASGGPFRGRSRVELEQVTVAEALDHPTWSMGRKITVDSATLANKGLELIEAHWLFGIPYDRIDVVVHPTSIVHSLVRFRDGALLAHLGRPDMRVPISFALTYPDRAAVPAPALDLAAGLDLHFEAPDGEAFPLLPLARVAGERGGTFPCAYNAANEVAVAAFLEGRITFPEIAETVADVLEHVDGAPARDLDDLVTADAGARVAAERRLVPGMTIFVAIVGLGLLVFVHELGHFVASVALRMRPRKFYIGFPPAVLKHTRNGIEYGIGMIPLGGFVKIPGMHRPASADVDPVFGRAIEEEPGLSGSADRLRRALASGDHDAARSSLASFAELAAERPLSEQAAHGVERGVADIGDALGPDAYWRARTWKRVLVIFAGPAANILFAFVIFTGLYMTSGGKATTTVESIRTGSAAAAIGLQAGDRIVSINGVPMTGKTISRTITGSNGKPLTVVVLRDGSRLTLGPHAAANDGGVYRLGFVLSGVGLSAPAAARQSARVTGEVSKDIVASLGNLVTGEGRKDISSPVGIVQGSSDAAKQGTDSFLWVLGLISLSIALLNLLPFLPLDGGHIVFAIVEGIRGRTVTREVYERVSIVGIGLVLLLFVIGLTNDIGRLS